MKPYQCDTGCTGESLPGDNTGKKFTDTGGAKGIRGDGGNPGGEIYFRNKIEESVTRDKLINSLSGEI